MAKRKIWLSWMPSGDSAADPRDVVSKLTRYGLAVAGADWPDDLAKLAWAKLAEVLLDESQTDAWLLAGRRTDLEQPSSRQALSLLTTMVSQARGANFPMLVLCLDGALTADDLPLLARGAEVLNGKEASWAAKVVAAAARPMKPVTLGFYLNVHAHPLIGQFIELGPTHGEWNGAMLGVSGDNAQISHHSVGPRGEIPERGIVEFELQGIKANVGDREFTAWAVKNRLTPDNSYFLRVEGTPESLLVGDYPGEDAELEASVIDLF